jgi:hypothetical protein
MQIKKVRFNLLRQRRREKSFEKETIRIRLVNTLEVGSLD